MKLTVQEDFRRRMLKRGFKQSKTRYSVWGLNFVYTDWKLGDVAVEEKMDAYEPYVSIHCGGESKTFYIGQDFIAKFFNKLRKINL